MVDELVKRLSSLGVKGKEQTKNLAPLTIDENANASSEEEDEESYKESTKDSEVSDERFINSLEEMFKEAGTSNQINRITYPKKVANSSAKPYYPRPSPVDLQFEDSMAFTYVSYDRGSIVEWNVDGLSEYQIKNVLHYMTMYANASKSRGLHLAVLTKEICQKVI